MQKAIEQELNCKFIRIDPDKKDFDTFKAIIEIFRCTKKSCNQLTKNFLQIKFRGNNITSKTMENIVKKILPNFEYSHLVLFYIKAMEAYSVTCKEIL